MNRGGGGGGGGDTSEESRSLIFAYRKQDHKKSTLKLSYKSYLIQRWGQMLGSLACFMWISFWTTWETTQLYA